MKRVLFIVILVALFLCQPGLLRAGIFESKTEEAQKQVNKALELIELGVNQEAKNQLELAKKTTTEELVKDSNNGQALFVLGQANFYLAEKFQERNDAHKQLKKAAERDKAIKEEVYKFYNKIADLQERMKNTQSAIDYKIIACEFKPEARKHLAESFFREGSKAIFAGQYQNSDAYFQACLKLDGSYAPAITKAIYALAEKQENPCAKLILARHTFSYGPGEFKDQLIQFTADALKNCQSLAGKKEFELIREEYRVVIFRIAFPPDWVDYERGLHPIVLKAGERTSKRLKFPIGTYQNMQGSKDMQIRFIYPNGDIINGWEIDKMPEKDGYYIEALTDQSLSLRVK